jgi:hypothetical protein
MDGLGTLIAICFLITFGPPVLFIIIGVYKQKNNNKDSAQLYYILGAAWLIVGGGICATLMS